MSTDLTKKDLAVVILNYNGVNWLEKFMPSVISYSPQAQVYVVDNASTDDSVGYVQKNHPEVTVIRNSTNLGFAGGYNEGLKSVKEEIFCLLNSDVLVTENWVDSISLFFRANPNAAVVQPKILSHTQPDFFEYAGAAGGFIDFLGYPYCRGRIGTTEMEKDVGQYDQPTEIFWAGGCCFFIRKAKFWEVGGFDASFFAHQEEIDLCWRLKNQGSQIWYVPNSWVYHVGGGTLDAASSQKTYLNFRNNLVMLIKNLPVHLLFPVIFGRLVLDGFAAVWLGITRGPRHFLAVIRAHFAFYRMAIKVYKKRQRLVLQRYWGKISIFF